MSSGKNPLMLMMALTMPSAGHALGLGDIHVDSALNERLSAEIDIIGATAAELADLRAAIADRETFLRYGADRPAFLTSATFKVAHDSRGRPVLAVRSTEPFMEPVVNFLVDLRWHKGEVVRQYTLLLDPPGFGSANRTVDAPAVPLPAPAAALPAAPVAEMQLPISTGQSELSSERRARNTTRMKVGARATLRGIAWRVGARSELGLKKTMLAIFRSNPSAFDDNINRLRLGAVLAIPSHENVAKISDAEAKREIHAQMVAWHSPPKPIAAEVDKAPAPPGPIDRQSTSSSDAALDNRIHSLEQEINAMKNALTSEQSRIDELRAHEAQAADAQAAPVAPAPDAMSDVASASDENAGELEQASVAAAEPSPAPAPATTRYTTMIPAVAGLGLLAAALSALYGRLRRRVAKPIVAVAAVNDAPLEQPGLPTAATEMGIEEARVTAPDAADSIAADVAGLTPPLLAIPPSIATFGRIDEAAETMSRGDADDLTVKLRTDTTLDMAKVDATHLDYNLVDLDLTAQHVQMPSVLNEHAVVKERRTNLADVLKLAIEREPDRHDLRMKLLELYYAAAATNRQGFLEVVQKFVHERNHLQNGEWDKIAFMGRQIASESPMFAEAQVEDDELADCA